MSLKEEIKFKSYFSTIQIFVIVLVSCLFFTICSQLFSAFFLVRLKSNWSADFSHAEVVKGSKKSNSFFKLLYNGVRKWCLNYFCSRASLWFLFLVFLILSALKYDT